MAGTGTAPPFRFTTFDLDSCIAVAKAVQDNGGLLSSEQLAFHLGYKSANNGSFNTRLANTRLFGLVEGPSSAIRPTQRALEILHPDFPENAERARLDAFEAVPLFKEVLDAYHGQPLPDETGLRNALTTRWQVHADRVAMIQSRLMDSAEEAGLFRTAGNRTRMIRPAQMGGSTPPATPLANVPPSGHNGGDGQAPRGVRANKLIDGVLDELPPAGEWTEAELMQWLSFFEGALRVVYKLPKGAASGGVTP